MITTSIHKIISIRKKKIHSINSRYATDIIITFLDYNDNEQEMELSLFSDKVDNLKIQHEK